jgi:hypothetical protein
MVTANVTATFIKTVYVYEDLNLLLVYSLAIFFSTVFVIIGSYAFYRNGVSCDTKVSTFAISMQNPEVRRSY